MTYFTTGAQLQAAQNALPNTQTGNFVAVDSFFYGQQYMADYQGTLSPIEHFVQIGAARGYKPNATFDPTYYKNAFADLKNTDFNAADLLYHFMQYGLDEGRIPSEALATFDGTAYLAANPDVAAYVNANLAQFGGSVTNGALAHYVKFGAAEGRTAPGTSVSNGQTFTLTAGVDNIVGTAGNDAIIGDNTQTGNAGPGDQIDGGAGVDTFKLYITAATKVEDTILPTLKNVENVYIKSGEVTNTATVDVSSLAGVQSFELDSTKLNATATIKTTAAQEVKLSNSAATTTVTLDGAQKASVANVTKATLDVKSAAATGFALAATGSAASEVTLTNTGAKLTSLTISGDKAVTVSEAIASIKTVDASANTAGVTLKYTGTANDLTVKGGAGNDRFEIANFNDKDVVDGGAGKDTLAIALADAAAFTKAAAVTNVEVLAVTGGTTVNTTLNADYFGVNSFEIVGAIKHNVTLSNLANNGTVQLDADSGAVANLTVDVKGAIAGTNDVLNLTTDKDGADLATNKVAVLANGVEVINIASSSETGAGAFELDTLTSAQLKTITITGVGDVSVATVSTAALSSIDASAAKGAVSISAANSTAAVTFKGGEGVDDYTASNKGDTIFGSKGADQITLGTGADKLVYSAADQSNATAKDVVDNFNVNADLIQFAASLQTGTAVFTGTTAFSATAGKTQIGFTDAGNAGDLQVDFDGNGTVDFVVTLTGVTAADFGAANFVFA